MVSTGRQSTGRQSTKTLKQKLPPPKSRTLPSNTSRHCINFSRYTHKPKNITLGWLLFSIPLVLWDIGFVLLRPLSMPGGALHWPLWVPYEIYMRTDYMYGWKALEERNGFTAAQGAMNVPEILLYACYLYLVFSKGVQLRGAVVHAGARSGFLAQRVVGGRAGAEAVVVGFTASVMTCSKTVLYVLNEAFSGWSYVGHNEWSNLVCFWIIPSGTWIVASAFMSITFGIELLHRLTPADVTPLVDEKSSMDKE